jgi:hypothetical protein
MGQRAHASTHLHRDVPGRGEDAADRISVRRLAGARSVEIDDVEATNGVAGVALRQRGRVILDERRCVEAALGRQANVATIHQVDGGDQLELHDETGTSSRRSPSIPRISLPLFTA